MTKQDAPSGDWRDEMLAHIRTLIRQADPEIVEERKWKKPSNGMAGVPVWSREGIVCTGETYKHVVKLTFAKGAALEDPSRLFNAGLDGNTRRAVDLREGEAIDAPALQALVRAAVALNVSSARPTVRHAPDHTSGRGAACAPILGTPPARPADDARPETTKAAGAAAHKRGLRPPA